MYQTEPWTLEKKELRTVKNSYIKNREDDLAVSTARVRKLLEDNKDKVFSNSEIAENLGISLGTVSNITNRLESISNIKIVKVRQLKSALSQVFQHIDGPLPAVTKERGKRDVIVNVLDRFKQNPNEVFTKDDLMKVLENSENKIRMALQILLLNGTIKLVGSEFGKAKYQYKTGNKKGMEIYVNKDKGYYTLNEYRKEYNIKDTFKVDSSKGRLYYSSNGLLRIYPKEYLDKVAEQQNRDTRSILERLFNHS